MPTKLSISSYETGEVINPEDSVKFRIKATLADEEMRSGFLSFDVPSWPPLITFINATYSTKKVKVENYGSNAEYRIRSYNVSARNATTSRLTLWLTTTPKNAIPNDKFILTASPASTLNALTGQTLTMIQSIPSTKGAFYLDFSIPIGSLSTLKSSTNSLINSIRETLGNITYNEYTFSVNASEYTNPTNRADVKDILIFSYTKTLDVPGVTETKFLLKDPFTTQVNEKNPPNYSDVSSYLTTKNGGTVRFKGDQTPLVDIYVAIARYTRSSGVWSGEWLQKDANGNAIWKKLVRSSQ